MKKKVLKNTDLKPLELLISTKKIKILVFLVIFSEIFQKTI